MFLLSFCVACGDDNPEHLHHHHFVQRSCGGTDDHTNLITLCVACHGKMHGVEWSLNHKNSIKAGMARVKITGKTKSGRAIGRPRSLTPAQKTEIRERKANGESCRLLAGVIWSFPKYHCASMKIIKLCP
jgi:hypothetical protein